MSVRGASKTIQQTLLSWTNVIALPHRFGGTGLRITPTKTWSWGIESAVFTGDEFNIRRGHGT